MSILIIPLFISPVIVGQSWALFLQRPFGPADYLLSQLLGHPVEISWLTAKSPGSTSPSSSPMSGNGRRSCSSSCSRGWRRSRRISTRRRSSTASTRSQTFLYVTLPQLAPIILLAVTFRLLDAVKLFDIIFMHDRRRPGHQDLHDLLLPLPDRLPAIPPLDGDGGKLDLPDPALRRHHGAGAPPAARGDRADGERRSSRRSRRRKLRAGAVAAPDPRRCSSSSCWCRSIGWSSPRSSRAATI